MSAVQQDALLLAFWYTSSKEHCSLFLLSPKRDGKNACLTRQRTTRGRQIRRSLKRKTHWQSVWNTIFLVYMVFSPINTKVSVTVGITGLCTLNICLYITVFTAFVTLRIYTLTFCYLAWTNGPFQYICQPVNEIMIIMLIYAGNIYFRWTSQNVIFNK